MGAPHAVPPHPWVVLHVDDDESVLSAIRLLLEKHLLGVRVIGAADAAGAEAALRKERVDVVLADFALPDIEYGVKLLFAAHRLRPDVPLLLLTGHPDDPLVKNAVRTGLVEECLSKAASPDDVVESVERHLQYDPDREPLLQATA
ncbi:MAG: response regulator [Thermoplasmatota archaeon]